MGTLYTATRDTVAATTEGPESQINSRGTAVESAQHLGEGPGSKTLSRGTAVESPQHLGGATKPKMSSSASTQWSCVFDIRARTDLKPRYETDLLLHVSESLAKRLRTHVTILVGLQHSVLKHQHYTTHPPE